MGEIRTPALARLTVAMIGREFDDAERKLVEKFGPILRTSDVWPFRFTDYYEKEMGRDLSRKLLAFDRMIDPGELPAIKRWTNDLEGPSPRAINLDPGYVTLSKLVLASTKDFAHRVYAGSGIYAEVTLVWTKGSFIPREWTYPDYRSPEFLAFFNAVRESLR